MPSTITIQNTLNWLAAYVQQRPTVNVNSIANEPGLTAANRILTAMVAAPLRWNWNRAQVLGAFSTIAGTSDYIVNIPNYGYLEKATGFSSTLQDPTFELEVFPVLALDTKQNQPAKISAVIDDGAGNITFRLLPVPDLVYSVNLTYQKSITLITSLTGTWAPVPDKYSYIYEIGLLGMMQGLYNTQLYMTQMELFFRQLVSAAEGMTESERAMFLEDHLRDARATQTNLAGASQGRQARL